MQTRNLGVELVVCFLASGLAFMWFSFPLLGKGGRRWCGFRSFLNRRNRVSRSFSDDTDRKLAGPSSQTSFPSVLPRHAPKTINQTTASQSKHGGCRGTVVGAVVEKARAGRGRCRGWNATTKIDASSKESKRRETAFSTSVSLELCHPSHIYVNT